MRYITPRLAALTWLMRGFDEPHPLVAAGLDRFFAKAQNEYQVSAYQAKIGRKKVYPVFGAFILGLFVVAAQTAQMAHFHFDHSCNEGLSFTQFSKDTPNEGNSQLGTEASHEDHATALSGLCALCAAGNLTLQIQLSFPSEFQRNEYSITSFEFHSQKKTARQLYRLYPTTSPPFYS